MSVLRKATVTITENSDDEFGLDVNVEVVIASDRSKYQNYKIKHKWNKKYTEEHRSIIFARLAEQVGRKVINWLNRY